MRLVQRQAEDASKAQAQAAVKRERFHEGMVRAMRAKGTPNAKFAAFHRLQGRAIKAVKGGKLDEAIAIGIDLAEAGFKDQPKLEELRLAIRAARTAARETA